MYQPKRTSKKEKAKNTFNKYGKYTKKNIRIINSNSNSNNNINIK